MIKIDVNPTVRVRKFTNCGGGGDDSKDCERKLISWFILLSADYLHDIRYLKSEARGLEMQIESELWTLKLLLGVTIGMTTTLMILTVIILLKLQLKRTKKQRKQALELPAVIYSNKVWALFIILPQLNYTLRVMNVTVDCSIWIHRTFFVVISV